MSHYVESDYLVINDDFDRAVADLRALVTSQRLQTRQQSRRLAATLQALLGPGDLAPTEAVLAEHGNMSSVTVLFVLDEILRRHGPAAGARGLVGAFGPGFAAELALLEFR